MALSTAVSAPKSGGAITVGLESDILGFDPIKVGVYDTSGQMVALTLFDTLTSLDDKGEARPKLALSWSHSNDYRTWTFKLRPNVKFQDGTPFNAQAVKFNLDREKDPKNRCRCAFYLKDILQIDAPDELTVVFRLKNPALAMPELMAVPASTTVIQSPTAIRTDGVEYNRHPVGTGPYRLKSWIAGDRIVVERNPDYWDPGHARLDRITFRPLPDANARFASLLSGQADVIWDDVADFENIKKARTDKHLTVYEHTGAGASVFVFNTKSPPLDDVRVRRALMMALNKREMAQLLTGGLARPATNPYGDGSWVKCSDDGALPYDPARAKALLREYGKPVKFKGLFTATPRGRAFAQVLQQFWKQVGAQLEIEQVDQATLVQRAFQRKFQFTPWRIIDTPDPEPQIFANFHSGSPVALANYSNPKLDRLLEKATVSTDRRERNDTYCAIARLINKEAIWGWYFQNTYYAIASSRVKGLPTMQGGVIDVSGAWLE